MKCIICGKEDEPSQYSSDYRIPMEEHQRCFICECWNKRIKEDSESKAHTVAIIDGTHYIIEPDNPTAAFQGFGGAKFQIEFFDGTKVITHNLWCQGVIPGEWKDKFPNNARFITGIKWVKHPDGSIHLE